MRDHQAGDFSSTDSSRPLAGRAVGRIAARAASSLAFGITLALIARLTTLPQFGIFMLAYSVGLVTGILAGLGAPTRVLRTGADHQSTPGALYAVSSTLVIGSFIACGLVYLAVAPHSAAYAGLLLALSDTLVSFAVSHMTAAERHDLANSLLLFHRLFPLAAVVIGYVTATQENFAVLSSVLCVPILVALVMPALFVPIRQSVRQWRSPFAGGIGYWAYSISALIGQLQAPVLSAVTSASVVATYTMAAKVVGPISILTASVSLVAVPELVKRMASPPQFHRLFRGLQGLSIAYLVVVGIAAWPISHLVVYAVGPQYLAAEPIVIGMVIGAGISGCSQAFNSRLLALGHPFASSIAITAGALVALLLLATLGSGGLFDALWVVPICTEIVVVAIIAMASRRVGMSNGEA